MDTYKQFNQELIEECRKLLKERNIDSSLKLLSKVENKAGFELIIDSLVVRNKDLNKDDVMHGVLNHEQRTTTRNQITQGVISLLAEIENSLRQENKEAEIRQPSKGEKKHPPPIVNPKSSNMGCKLNFSLALTISLFLVLTAIFLFWFTFQPKNYQNRFYQRVELLYGLLDEKQMEFGSAKSFLKENISLTLIQQTGDVLYLEMNFSKFPMKDSRKTISENKAVDFTLPFEPVDLQYTAQLIGKYDKEGKIKVFLNQEFVNSALGRNTSIFEPLILITESKMLDFILNIIISFIVSVLAGLSANFLLNQKLKSK